MPANCGTDPMKPLLRRIGKYDSITDMVGNGTAIAKRLLRQDVIRSGMRILDWGAGLGRMAIPLKSICEVDCFEPHVESREYLVQRGLNTSPSGRYDVVLCFYVLQHLSLNAARATLRSTAGFSDRLLFTYPTYEQAARANLDVDKYVLAWGMSTSEDCSRSAIMPIAGFGELFRDTPYDVMTCREVRGIVNQLSIWSIDCYS